MPFFEQLKLAIRIDRGGSVIRSRRHAVQTAGWKSPKPSTDLPQTSRDPG
jgi:hypothetical protein